MRALALAAVAGALVAGGAAGSAVARPAAPAATSAAGAAGHAARSAPTAARGSTPGRHRGLASGVVRARLKAVASTARGTWSAPLTPPSVGPSPPPSTDPSAPTTPPSTTTTTTTTTPPPPTPPPTTLPKRVAIDEGEWYVRPSRPTVAAGDVEINLSDLGEDDHDLTILDASGQVVKKQPITAGDERQLTITLAAGRYKLICSLPGHEGLGMKSQLDVSSG